MAAKKFFKLKGKTLAIIDWANVYGWSEKLKWQVDPKKLYKYLKSYLEIEEIRFYFGAEKGNKKSEGFQKKIKKIGYNLISKELKWVPVSLDKSHFKKFLEELARISGNLKKSSSDIAGQLEKIMKTPIYRRKCDFDCEIAIDVMKNIDAIDSLILFSGDGDYAVLVDETIKNGKQAIVVFAKGCKGKEYGEFKKGLYLCSVEQLKEFLE
ncbi:MAG: hypothetical protein CEN88_89 [Candidatus Berkelbacteria bacterium Licking1014_2]|uniref:NYN domain-containing protein n=1 Tax=Candidatus Berkelbacteria bacterium Licking1014_2 TaxID=2017146 RepID=A0A554LWM7_9BACT|nr:MAG: hypothetical protein CEN88_89 [Candidatus Berkelbacteria bacterium Licking1014_2]